MAEHAPARPTESTNPVRDGVFIRRVIVVVSITLLSLALAMLLWYGVRVLLVGFAGVLFAVLLRSIAAGVSRVTGLSPGWSLGLTVVLLVGLFVALGFLLAPSIVEQTSQLVDRMPAAIERIKQYLA